MCNYLLRKEKQICDAGTSSIFFAVYSLAVSLFSIYSQYNSTIHFLLLLQPVKHINLRLFVIWSVHQSRQQTQKQSGKTSNASPSSHSPNDRLRGRLSTQHCFSIENKVNVHGTHQCIKSITTKPNRIPTESKTGERENQN